MNPAVRAVLIGTAVAMAGTLPRNVVFALNLNYGASVPWGVPVMAAYLWVFWRFLDGSWMPGWDPAERKSLLRARRIDAQTWILSLVAGAFAIVALVFALKLVNRMILLPPQTLPDLSHVPRFTVFVLLLAAAPIAGIVEEAAFRGYMQGPIEERYGLLAAVLITGTMFGVVHLDFTLILWPYYVAVAAIYGSITYITKSILPSIVLHSLGNTYSNLDILLNGRAEWQAATSSSQLIWVTGTDAAFWQNVGVFVVAALVVALAFTSLRQRSHLRSSEQSSPSR